MKAFVLRSYGSPDHLDLAAVDTPVPAPGEVLVARHTDPGWIALFANASAIAVERGSLLSHSAIVARELGIPAIVSITDVTRWLQSGDEVEMDGASGVIRRLHRTGGGA